MVVQNTSFCPELADCKSIVFDIDGTLVCSEPIIQRTILSTVQNYLTPAAKQEFEAHIPYIQQNLFGHIDDIFSSKLFSYLGARAMLIAEISKMDTAAFIHRFSADRQVQYLAFCEQGLVTPMPGVVQFVSSAYGYCGALAINTGSPEVLSAPMLRHVFRGLLDIDRVFPGHLRTYINNLPHGLGKPSPDGYIRAARLLGIPPWELAAVVDRGNDCMSALRAGYKKVVVVPENNDRSSLEAPTGKHSLVQFFESYPLSEQEELRSKVIIVNSLIDLVTPSS